MIKPMFIACQPFGPDAGGRWGNYVKWSGLTQLTEVVSLDELLCPNVIDEISDEDWNHNVHEDFLSDFFWDLDYLLERVRAITDVQVLAALREPGLDCAGELSDRRFVFEGYDLVDKRGGISVLTNCGGFPASFENSELSRVGLIDSYGCAFDIQCSLRTNYPDVSHTDCCVWALWRMVNEGDDAPSGIAPGGSGDDLARL
ncbi:MAG: hypothetical protein HZB26_19890 [Candidatus Hydrogenedentes bacterium]|nr:hypothetical protein [Candidatus Hydrogenedentota bacterium]